MKTGKRKTARRIYSNNGIKRIETFRQEELTVLANDNWRQSVQPRTILVFATEKKHIRLEEMVAPSEFIH